MKLSPDKSNPDRRRHEDEIEQLRVAVEDAREETAALAAERDNLVAELARRTVQLREAEARLRRREEAAEVARAGLMFPESMKQRLVGSGPEATAEELRVAVEEMQTLAEELEEANHDLERRVAERTAELTALNEKLRASEGRLRFAQRAGAAGSWDWDIRANAMSWSPEQFDLHGLDPLLVSPSRAAWLASIQEDDRAATELALEECLLRRNPDFRAEFRVNHLRRGPRWLSARGRLVCDLRGDPVRLVGLTIDITERKRAELSIADANDELRREIAAEVKAHEATQARLFQTLKLEALGQLTGGVAHDFNNLLSVITSGTALLRRIQDAERRERLLDAMQQAALRGADLTRRLLTFARRQALRPMPLDLAAWLDDMHELLARSLQRDIEIEITTEPDLWPALVDGAELELAVLNLAVNARDAMPRGGTLYLIAGNVVLHQGSETEGLEGEFVRLAVRDTGTGMSPEVLARAFEPFFSTKEVGRGTGLGLAQVYGFARQSGGTARVSSPSGDGTTVTLLLPRATEDAAEPAAPGLVGREDANGYDFESGLRVLLIEDDDDVAALTAEMLRHLDHTVSRVASGPAAQKALAAGLAADLVLSDVIMPGGLDGLDLAQSVGETHPDLPVLLYSGFGGAPGRVAASGLPLLRKPFSIEELQRAIATARAARFGTQPVAAITG
jgi:PAS domain S-box-containing protein